MYKYLFKIYNEKPIIIHLIILFCVSFLLFPLHEDRLFNALDGNYMKILVKNQWHWMPMGTYLTLNLLQGMGGIFFPINMNIIPSYFIQSFLFDGDISTYGTYALFSLELFIAGFIAARLFQFSKAIALVSSWILVLISLPFLNKMYINAIYQLSPHMIDIILLNFLFFYLFFRIGRNSRLITTFSVITVCLIPPYLMISHPASIILYIPTTCLITLGLIILSTTRSELYCKLLSCALILLTLIYSKAFQFLFGNLQFTSTSFFTNELLSTSGSIDSASILFQGNTFPIGKYLVPLSLISAIYSILSNTTSKLEKQFSILFLITTSVIIFYGLLIFKLSFWRGPQGHYFEFSLWPLYIAYSMYGLFIFSRKVIALFYMTFAHYLEIFYTDFFKFLLSTSKNSNSKYYILLLLPLSYILIDFIANPRTSAANIYERFPSDQSPIIQTLIKEASIKEGSAFKGYVATFTGLNGKLNEKEGINWFNQHAYDHTILKPSLKNDHRFNGLWYFNIPTLNDYTPYTTPTLYSLASRLLARPSDTHIRNIIIYTVPNISVLKMLGVKYVITEQKIETSNVKIRNTVPLNNGESLRLYEIIEPNLATYSPIKAIFHNHAKDTIHAMKSNWNPKHTVFLHKPTEAAVFSPAKNIKMTTGKNGIHIKSNSDGQSLILLPIQFSHCLKATSVESSNIKLLPANLAQTALLFSHNVDTIIQFETGLFDRSECRLQDIDHVKKLHLDGLSKAYPLQSIDTHN